MYGCLLVCTFYAIRYAVAAHLCVMITSSNNPKDLGVTMDSGRN
jgi:hypothetical protein